MPQAKEIDSSLLAKFEEAKQIVSGIRAVRKDKGIANKEPLELQILGQNQILDDVIRKMGNLKEVNYVKEKSPSSASFLVDIVEYSIPLENNIDVESEIRKMQEEINYLQGFLNSVMKKLSNERFVQNAKPEIVEVERKKKSDAESKIQALQDSIAALRK